MKKSVILVLLAAIAASAFGASSTSCNLVIDYPPGGTSDTYVRLLQKQNPDIMIEYKTGGAGAVAINHISENKEIAWFGSPVFALKNSPVKNPPVELVRILVGAPILAVSTKPMSWDKLLTGKVNIGFPAIGTSHHLIALQLQEKNPNIQLIPSGGDAKALPMVMNGDLDLYLISATAGNNWVRDFKMDTFFAIDYNKPLIRNDLELNYLGFNGIFVHKDATPEQKAHIMSCIEKATAHPEWAASLKNLGAVPIDLKGAEKDNAYAKFLALLKKYNQ